MIAAGGFGQFVSGLVLGVLLGLLVGPLIRSWLAWHEWAEASREAELTEDVLERMETGPSARPRRDGKAVGAEGWPGPF